MDLLSEEEQWEALKRWLRTNGPSIAIMVVLMLLGWFGWQWWQGRKESEGLAAAVTYEKILQTFDQNQQAEALALIEALRGEYPESPYVSASDLVAARVFVLSNQLDKAVERLERVAREATDQNLRPIATLRLARVMSSQGKYDEALARLGTASMGVHEEARLEARGDILLAKGDRAGALKEYLAALALLPAADAEDAPPVRELLELKIRDLGGTPPVAKPAVESPAPAAAAAPAPAPEATP